MTTRPGTANQSDGTAGDQEPSEYRLWLREVVYNIVLAYREASGSATSVSTETDEVRGILIPGSRLNTCIEATRLIVDTFTLLGVAARPVAVDAYACNEQAIPALLQRRAINAEEDRAGAWTVGVDHRHPYSGKDWNGHLVPVLRNPESEGGGRTLIDATADQFTRVERDIVIAPIVILDIRPGQPWTPQDPIYTIPPPPGANERGIIGYSPIPPGHSVAKQFKETPAWNAADLPDLAARIAAQTRPNPLRSAS